MALNLILPKRLCFLVGTFAALTLISCSKPSDDKSPQAPKSELVDLTDYSKCKVTDDENHLAITDGSWTHSKANKRFTVIVSLKFSQDKLLAKATCTSLTTNNSVTAKVEIPISHSEASFTILESAKDSVEIEHALCGLTYAASKRNYKMRGSCLQLFDSENISSDLLTFEKD